MFPEQFIQLSGYFIHFLQYILYIRFDARHGSHILYLELSFMGYRFFSASTMLLNSTSQLVLGHVQSVQAAQHTSPPPLLCLSSPDIRPDCTTHITSHSFLCLSSPDIRPDCTTHITSHSLMPFFSGYPSRLHTSHLVHSCLSSPDIRPDCTTHITSHSLMSFISGYPSTPHNT